MSETRLSSRRRRSRGNALITVLVLVVVILGITGALLLSSLDSSQSTARRLERSTAYNAALSGVHAAIADLGAATSGGGSANPGCFDWDGDPAHAPTSQTATAAFPDWSGLIARINGTQSPPYTWAQLHALWKDGAYCVRSVPAGGAGANAYYIVTAQGLVGRELRMIQCYADPSGFKPFTNGLFGAQTVEIEGIGKADAYDASAGAYSAGSTVGGQKIAGSNGDIAIDGSSP